MVDSSIVFSALAGAGSFFSPCILPILPAFVSYLSGTTLNEIQDSSGQSGQQSLKLKISTRLNIFLNTVYFVLGFSLVFALLGVFLNSVLLSVGVKLSKCIDICWGSCNYRIWCILDTLYKIETP